MNHALCCHAGQKSLLVPRCPHRCPPVPGHAPQADSQAGLRNSEETQGPSPQHSQTLPAARLRVLWSSAPDTTPPPPQPLPRAPPGPPAACGTHGGHPGGQLDLWAPVPALCWTLRAGGAWVVVCPRFPPHSLRSCQLSSSLTCLHVLLSLLQPDLSPIPPPEDVVLLLGFSDHLSAED